MNIDTDESAVYKIDLLPDQKTIVTEVMGDGACFLHSILLSYNAPEYLIMSKQERRDYVRQIREGIADHFTIDVLLEKLPSLIVADSKKILGLLKIAIKYAKNEHQRTENPMFDEIDKENDAKQLLKTLDEESIPDSLLNVEFVKGAYARKIIARYGKAIEPIAIMIEKIFIKHVYKKTKKNIGTYCEWVSNSTFKFIADIIGVFVIFIDEQNERSVYNYPITIDELERYKEAVIINYAGNHFQSIAIQENGVNIRRFKMSDERIKPLIDAIRK